MTGEKKLSVLIKEMTPLLNDGEYVFCTQQELPTLSLDQTVAVIKEEEGFTMILPKEQADRLNLSYSCVCSWITLKVHSSLEAVGLTAAFSTALADENISCNVVAGYYHDHLFVPTKDANQALGILISLSQKAKERG